MHMNLIQLHFKLLYLLMTDLTILFLIPIGFIFGIINTLAGGASILTLPMLLFLGLSPHQANATNRLGGIAQTITATYAFLNQMRSQYWTLCTYLPLILIGSTTGSWLSLLIPNWIMELLISFFMALIALFTLFMPSDTLTNTSLTAKSKPVQILGLFLLSLYGGFLQAGIGLLALFYFRFICGFNLIQSTALKVALITLLTCPALLVFMYDQQVQWVEGGILAIGGMSGAYFSAQWTLKEQGEKWIRLCLPIAALLMVAMLLYQSL